ncbi:hypothetical protein G9P44_005865 [Scheffersomyces stipitis]|nr:hypothetical protein G9P44_005865 [Scheffersomyces stipitis]
MLRQNRAGVLLVRKLHCSVVVMKPFDISQLARDNSSEKRNQGFNIESLIKNRMDLETDKVVSENATAAPNRFATMFDKEKRQAQKKTGPRRNSESTHHHNAGPYPKKPYGKTNSGSKTRPEIKTRPHKRVVRFEFKTGSDQAQAALKSIIAKVHALSTNYKIKFIDPVSGEVKLSNLVDIANSTDLREAGLQLLPCKEGDLPSIKKVSTREMLKLYSDELAAEKEKALLQSGSVAAQRALNQRLKSERKKSAAKLLNIFWNISLGDLKNQKKTELANRLCKGETFTIYLKRKGREVATPEGEGDEESETLNMYDIRRSLAHDEDALNIETQRRELISQQLFCILDEMPCTYEIEGQKENKLKVTVSPRQDAVKQSISPSSEECTLSAKDLKKQRQLQKQKEREELLKLKKQEKEDNLDSLYSFKIED